MHPKLVTEEAEPGEAAAGADAVPGGRPLRRVTHLRADCDRCAGLCCVAPAFDGQQGFGFSKPAHVPCTHLQGDFRCDIHAELAGRGFPACSSFDCYGAGQRVTRLFRGKSWQDSAQLAARMFQAYSRYRGLHELLALLDLALAHVAPGARARLQQRLEWLEALCESGEALHCALTPESLRGDVLAEIREALQGAPAGLARLQALARK